LVDRQEFLHEELSGDSVGSGHCEGGDRFAGVDQGIDILGVELCPFVKTGVFNIYIVVVNGTLRLELDGLPFVLPPVGEFLTVIVAILLSEAGTEAPYASENEDVLETLDITLKHGLQKLANGGNHGQVDVRHKVLESLANVLERFFNVLIKESLEVLFALSIELCHRTNPRLDVSLPLVTISIRDVEDTGTRDSGGRGELQVTNFENQTHVSLNDNTFVGSER